MGVEIKRILFASDLSDRARTVFSYAVALAGRFEATIVIINVMEAMSPSAEAQVESAYGNDSYQDLKMQKKENARQILINKKKDALKRQDQLTEMHRIEDKCVDNSLYRVVIEDVIITEGDISEEIISNSIECACDVIVMGCPHHSFLQEKLSGGIVRKVLRRSKKPVFLVPFSG